MIFAALLACAEPAEPGAANPLTTIERAIDRTPFEGAVVARVEAGDYVYLEVDDRWVVGFDAGLYPGDRARVSPIGRARNFHSARTGRNFDELWFAVTRPVTAPSAPAP